MNQRFSAFTLVELIVVMAIIAILFVLLATDYQALREQKAMQMAAEESLAMMSEAKVMAESGYMFNSDTKQWACLGGYFELGTMPEFLSMGYDSETEECLFDTAVLTDYGTSSTLAPVRSIELGGMEYAGPLWIVFLPMSGEVVVLDSSASPLSGNVLISFGSLDLVLNRVSTHLSVEPHE